MLTLAKQKKDIKREKKHSKTKDKRPVCKRETLFAQCPRTHERICHCKDRPKK
jgi:hypothetical protein